MVIMDIRLESMESRPVKLKFGIDALLSTDRFASSKEKESAHLKRDTHQAVSSDEEYNGTGLSKTTILNITKPLPQMPAQCSDCVSSLYGCCRLSSTGNCARDTLPGLPRYLGAHHVTYNSSTSGGPLFTVQPIRPFATRAALRIPISHSSSSSSSVMSTGGGGGTSKRKRSWSRAVFSNLQRKGLERRFQIQKYITKPDRRQLAATLGLTDAQVKVWFQNRRMKWRHATLKSGDNPAADSTQEEDLQIDVDTIHDEDM